MNLFPPCTPLCVEVCAWCSVCIASCHVCPLPPRIQLPSETHFSRQPPPSSHTLTLQVHAGHLSGRHIHPFQSLATRAHAHTHHGTMLMSAMPASPDASGVQVTPSPTCLQHTHMYTATHTHPHTWAQCL